MNNQGTEKADGVGVGSENVNGFGKKFGRAMSVRGGVTFGLVRTPSPTGEGDKAKEDAPTSKTSRGPHPGGALIGKRFESQRANSVGQRGPLPKAHSVTDIPAMLPEMSILLSTISETSLDYTPNTISSFNFSDTLYPTQTTLGTTTDTTNPKETHSSLAMHSSPPQLFGQKEEIPHSTTNRTADSVGNGNWLRNSSPGSNRSPSSNPSSASSGDSIKETQATSKTNQLISFFNQPSHHQNRPIESPEKRETKAPSTEPTADRKNINNSLLLKIEENLNTQLLQSGKMANQNVRKVEPMGELNVRKVEPMSELNVRKVEPVSELNVRKVEPMGDLKKVEPVSELNVRKVEPMGDLNVRKVEPVRELNELSNSNPLNINIKPESSLASSEGTISGSDWTLPVDTRRVKIRDESIRIGTKQAPPPIPFAFTGGEVLKNVPPGQLTFELEADFWVIDVVEGKIVFEERVHIEAFSDGLKIQMKNEVVILTAVLTRSLPSLVSTEEYLQILSKDFRTINLHFDSTEDKRKVLEFLNYFRSDSSKVSSPTVAALDPAVSEYLYDPTEEMKRQGYDTKMNLWRVAGSQDKRIVPFEVTDEILEGSKTFRHRGQYPSYCWGCWDPSSRKRGALLLRFSRPTCMTTDEVKDFKILSKDGNYSTQVKDLDFISTLFRTVNHFREGPNKNQLITVIDTSGSSSAVTKDAYRIWLKFKHRKASTDEIFKAAEKIFQYVHSYITNWTEFESIASMRWPTLLTQYIGYAMHIVKKLNRGGVVAVQNAGPQYDDTDSVIVSLVQIIMDPFYRTIKGFLKLIWKEWINYSIVIPPFTQPWTIFVFFLNCVYEILQKQGKSFEFTSRLLILTMDHLYSTKLPYSPNPTKETYAFIESIIAQRSEYTNPNYTPTEKSLLLPSDPQVLASTTSSVWYEYLMRYNYSITQVHAKYISNTQKITKSSYTVENEPLFWIPETSESLVNLESLQISKCYLTMIPASFAQMNKITKLNLSQNCLTCIPEQIGTLKTLRSLNLSHNRISTIPSLHLPFLESLMLDNNFLSDIGELNKLSTLIVLSLKKNILVHFPVLSNLSKIEHLYLGENKISFFPSQHLVALGKLSVLNLDKNDLVLLPDRFNTTPNLTTLSVSNNALWCLPPSLYNCKNLTSLNVSSNTFSALPDELEIFQHMKFLDASQNKLTTLPIILSKLKEIEEIYIDNNRLTEVPLWIYKMSSVKKLSLKGNVIQKLSVGVSHMRSLIYLNLADNQLTELPLPLGSLKDTLEYVNIAGNLFSWDVPESYYENTKLLLNYLNELLCANQEIYRVKLMVVGQECVGKTTLISKLAQKWTSSSPPLARDKKFEPISTDGIDINTMQFTIAESKLTKCLTTTKLGVVNRTTAGIDNLVKSSISNLMRIPNLSKKKGKHTVTVNAWDFAGQDVYYATHQFFLSSWSVYLLVFDLREFIKVDPSHPQQLEWNENAMLPIDFWIQSIKSRVKSPTIFLVGTHFDELTNERQQIQSYLEKLWTKVTARYECWNLQIFAISCTNQENINLLRSSIELEISNLPEIGQTIPYSHLYFEKLLSEYKSDIKIPVITQSELFRLASICTLSDPDVALGCTHILQDLGSLLYFEKVPALKDLVILDPQWLFSMFATIFTTKHGWIKGGVLDSKLLVHIWKSYPAEIYQKLLILLEKFEVVYPIARNIEGLISVVKEDGTNKPFKMNERAADRISDAYLIPSLLPKEKPNLDAVWLQEPQHGTFHIDRTFMFSFLPAGLFSRLVSRFLMYANYVEKIWASGIIAVVNMRGATASIFVSQELQNNKITVQVRSQDLRSTRTVFVVVVEMILRLGSEWKSLTLKRRYTTAQEISIDLVEKLVFEDKTDHIIHNGVKYLFADIAPDLVLSNYSGPRVKFEEVKIVKKLGEGGFAVVYLGEIFGLPMAVKRIKFDFDSNEVKSHTPMENAILVHDNFTQEVLIQGNLKHPNILPIQYICMKPLCIIFEMCEFGDLYTFLHKWDTHIPWQLKLKISIDIAKGLKYLQDHQPPICHIDFKSPNILVSSMDPTRICAKISDFGSAQMISHPLNVRYVDNIIWLAPEILKDIPYDHRTDIYAYAVICYEILTRDDYFKNVRFMSEIRDKIISGERPEIIEECPPEYAEIIRATWQDNPILRPPMDWVIEKLEMMIAEGDVIEQKFGKIHWEAIQKRHLDKLAEEAGKSKFLVPPLPKIEEKVAPLPNELSDSQPTDAFEDIFNNFDNISNHPQIYEDFSAWLTKTHSMENLRLHKSVTEFLSQSDQDLHERFLLARAKEICHQFFGFGSIPPAISLDATCNVDYWKERISDLNNVIMLFNEVINEVRVILQDKFAKFVEMTNTNQEKFVSPKFSKKNTNRTQNDKNQTAKVAGQDTKNNRSISLRGLASPRSPAQKIDTMKKQPNKNPEEDSITIIPKEEVQPLSQYQKKNHLRCWRVPPGVAKRLPKLDISQDLNDYPLTDFLVDDYLYFQFESYLKNSPGKVSHHHLYFFLDFEDFHDSEYTAKPVLLETAKTIYNVWCAESSPIYDKSAKDIFSEIEKKISSNEITKSIFDNLGRTVKTNLLLKLKDFRQWYVHKRTQELKEKKKIISRLFTVFQKKEIMSYRLLKVHLDELLKSDFVPEFREYLKDRSSEPWLDFYIEIQNFKSKNPKEVVEILPPAMRIAESYLLDSANSSRIYLKNVSLMDKLKAAMATPHFTSVNMFDEILEEVAYELKKLQRDFCWSAKPRSAFMGREFETVLSVLGEDIDDKDKPKTSTIDLWIVPAITLCSSVLQFKTLTNMDEMIFMAKDIGIKYFLKGPQNTCDLSVFVEEHHLENVRNRLKFGVYSASMFDSIFEYLRRPVVMYYMEENKKK